jgi:hypothetical protein
LVRVANEVTVPPLIVPLVPIPIEVKSDSEFDWVVVW